MNTHQKAVFHFDSKTGEFLGESFSMPSPFRPDYFLLPSNATFDAPPACATNEVAVFINGTWERRPDWRNVKLYSTHDGAEVEISDIGVTPDDVKATDLPRPDATYIWKKGKLVADALRRSELKAQLQAMQWEAIKAERDRRRLTGGYRVVDKWYHSDTASRSQQLTLVAVGCPIGLRWKTMDGSFVTMTDDLARYILAAASANDQAIFAAAEQHKSAMLAAGDPESYDFSQGWPSQYSD